MNNKDDFLKDLLEDLKAKGFDKQELDFAAMLPQHMKELQVVVDKFLAQHVGVSPHNLEIYAKAIIGMAAQVQASLVVMMGMESYEEFCKEISNCSVQEYNNKVSKVFAYSVDHWLPGFLAVAKLTYGEDTLKAKRAKIKEAIKEVKLNGSYDKNPDLFVPTLFKQ